MSIELKPRQDFLDTALACGASLTGKPDGSEAITVVFTIDAWRKFNSAIQQAEAKTDEMDPLFVKGALSGIVDAQVRDLWPTKSATHPAPGVPDGFALVPLKATPKVAMVLYEGARNCFSPKVAEDLWQDALTAAQAQKGD